MYLDSQCLTIFVGSFFWSNQKSSTVLTLTVAPNDQSRNDQTKWARPFDTKKTKMGLWFCSDMYIYIHRYVIVDIFDII